MKVVKLVGISGISTMRPGNVQLTTRNSRIAGLTSDPKIQSSSKVHFIFVVLTHHRDFLSERSGPMSDKLSSGCKFIDAPMHEDGGP